MIFDCRYLQLILCRYQQRDIGLQVSTVKIVMGTAVILNCSYLQRDGIGSVMLDLLLPVHIVMVISGFEWRCFVSEFI